MSLKTLSSATPLEQIFEAIREDGGVIISDFLTPEELASFNDASAPMFEVQMTKPRVDLSEMAPGDVDFHATNTTHLRGLLGKLPTQVSGVVMNPIWHAIQHEFLKSEAKTYVGPHLLTTLTSYVLSLCVGFRVAPGASSQILHRDQSIHSVNAEEGSLKTSMVGCLIAGTKATTKNGATRVIPGSHLWGWDKIPDPSQTVGAEMEKGSAFFWLGSTYHGAGSNVCEESDKDSIRILYGIFGCMDYLRAEESQQLAVSPEVAKTLPREVLRRSGWAKGAGGAGFLDARDPIDVLMPL